MDVGVVGEKAFGMRVVEVGAVVDGGLESWGSAEDFRTPGISTLIVRVGFLHVEQIAMEEAYDGRYERRGRGSQMTIEMDDANGAVSCNDTAKKR